MIQIGSVVDDPAFAQPRPFIVHRSTGYFGLGGWQNTVSDIEMTGTIQPASAKDLQQVPQGDRVTGIIAIWSQQQIYTTHDTNSVETPGVSDIIEWQGDKYRVQSSVPWVDAGYWKVIAVRMSGK